MPCSAIWASRELTGSNWRLEADDRCRLCETDGPNVQQGLMKDDFPKSSKKDTSTPHPSKVLIDWVKRYFVSRIPAIRKADRKDEEPKRQDSIASIDTSGSRSAFDALMRPESNGSGRGEVVRQTRKLPLILQHSGHSRTIVGYEETHRGTNLLLFDPGR